MRRDPVSVDLGLQGGGAHGAFTWGVLDRLLEESWPLVRECTSSDTILVQINPIERPGTPKTAREIHNRLNEIAFNATLIKEMRAAALLRHVTDPGSGEGAIWAKMRVHRITSEIMLELGYSSKLIAEWAFFCMLRDEGRRSAAAFLDAHGTDLGVRSTLDIDAYLEGI